MVNFHFEVSKDLSSPFLPLSVMYIVASGASSMILSILLAWSGSIWFITRFFIFDGIDDAADIVDGNCLKNRALRYRRA